MSFGFSIIIPLYNKEKSVLSTVQSVLDQSYFNFELIIVNDGSTDSSLEIIKTVKDSRIILISQENAGVSAARNTGIKASSKEYIIPLDADDLFLPGALDEFVYMINNFPNAEVFITSGFTNNSSKKGHSKRYYVRDYYWSSTLVLAKYGTELMMTGIVAIKNEVFNRIGNYNVDVTHGEDIELWNRLKNNCILAKSEICTFIYRLNTENRATFIPIFNQKHVKIEDKYQNFLFYGIYQSMSLIFAIRLSFRDKGYKKIVVKKIKYFIFIPVSSFLFIYFRLLR